MQILTTTTTPSFPPLFRRDMEWILAIVFMRFSATLALFSSLTILYMILSDRTFKLKRIHNRIIFMLSSFDIISTLGWLMATSAAPKGQVYGAIGNKASCSFQGFIVQLATAVPSYNLALSIYYLLVVRYNIPDARIESWIEPCMHVFCILYPVGTAIAGLALQLYHFKGAICWIEASPWGCNRGTKGIAACTENPNSLKYELAFVGVWYTIVGVGISSIMILIYCTVRGSERRLQKFNFKTRKGTVSPCNTSLSKDRRNTGIQAMLYISSFVFTFVWAILYYIAAVVHGENPHTSIMLLFYFFTPLQGLWNLIIYIRPRFIVVSEECPRKTFLWKVKTIIFTPESQRRQSSLKASKALPRRSSIVIVHESFQKASNNQGLDELVPPSTELESHVQSMMSTKHDGFVGDILLSSTEPELQDRSDIQEAMYQDDENRDFVRTSHRRSSLVSILADEMHQELLYVEDEGRH